MGTVYTVLLLDQKCSEWLDTEGVSHPAPSATPRYPTPREIAQVLRQLPDSTVSIHSDALTQEWTAHVAVAGGAWTQIRVRGFSSDDVPHEFYFSKGWPETVFAITERLAQRCGTFVIVDDSSVRPIVVAAGSDPQDLIRQYDAV
jgi:hypothetical protein